MFKKQRADNLVHGCANHDTEGKRFKSPIHCFDVTKPPYLFSGELCTSPLHCKLLFVYTVCCRRTGQCFSVLRKRKSDVILTQWTAVVGEVTSPSSDTMCHSCGPMVQCIGNPIVIITQFHKKVQLKPFILRSRYDITTINNNVNYIYTGCNRTSPTK